MSVEPPSSGRPTGPPSGPLSGPSQPPSGPPSQPPGSSGGTPEPRRPWWRSVPRVATIATALVAAVVLAVVFTRSDGGGSKNSASGEVFLQSAAKTGPEPFTESTAKDSSAPPISASPTGSSEPANAVRGVDGGAPGLYGGTRNVSSCDVARQIKALQAAPAKNRAFASVAGVQPSGVPSYLRSLTPVQLRMDTRVTNHGYRDGAATSYQAVLQTGTAVLVDSYGVPRVRCACGNPLAPPVAQSSPRRTGDTWSSYRPANVVVVAPSTTVINIFVIYDPDHDEWIARHQGDTGHKDKPTAPPAQPSPSVTVTTPTAPTSPSTPSTPTSPTTPVPCVSTSTALGTPTGTPRPSASPCPPATSTTPSTPSAPTSSPPSDQDVSPDSSAPQPPLASDTTPGTTQSASLSGVPPSPEV
ncbi:DUF6777 domain-containing protein [Streptomyces sp. NPDC047072]|uniref:DUF6777 domain-containing protein n=1 Tax=Streptomyces sp. NPDC047072 TaxID=3154809 RepID=UPI0033FE9618